MKVAYSQLLHSIGRTLKVKSERLKGEMRLEEDLGLTDWERTLLINRLERRYEVNISDNRIPQLQTVRALTHEFVKLKNRP
ncbi:MAG: acyl carrier protein [Chitinophagaceae bacterium]|uniref:acyl carrier protein n=1 Tax=unclassified Paraflavitalea TaxID=2798305 RepID=UPI003D3543FC|nr:acyl carrier protein [Chitinophagaceae bacterium]